MRETLETDYLVVGTGAAGMAFTDALLSHSDATVTLVDRRHAPGGHWIDAYPFVRLHQPSAFYGVSSVPLGTGAVEASGVHAGFHEQASADELRAYYAQVLDRHFLPTGRVRHLPCTDHSVGPDGRHVLTSRLTGAVQEVHVRRKWVDTSYMEGRIPATSPPPFEVAEGVRCVAVGDVARLREPLERTCAASSATASFVTTVRCPPRLARPPLRPIFEAHRITPQTLFWSFSCYPFALLGVIEACIADTDEKNRLCPPIHYWDTPRDYLAAYLALLTHERARSGHPSVVAWARATRLNPLSDLGAHRDHPLVAQTWGVAKQYGAAAAANLATLLQ